jgi:Secreted and surface protein containing fasciclin-like repeats
MPTDDYKALLENSTELKKVLTFHIVEGKIMLKDLKNGQVLTSVQGENLTVKVGSNKVVTVNGANITEADITASNGIIHIIDTVLKPK